MPTEGTNGKTDLPTCSLDESRMRQQRARYARIAASVTRLDGGADAVRLELADDFDRRTLQEMVQVEARCCPFFRFGFSEAPPKLTITVDDPQTQPALEALASELGVQPQTAH
jgi:hypothetical protein